jgi:hypothetical protein
MLIEVFDENVNTRFANITEQFNTFAFVVRATKTGNAEITQCGLLHLHVENEQLGNIRLFSKTVLLNQAHLVRFDRLNFPFFLVFEKLKFFSEISLQIYRETMPLNFEPVVSVPNIFGSTTNSTPVPITTSSVSLLAANANRKKLIINNNSNQELYIDLDATASVSDFSMKIPKIAASGFVASYELEGYTGAVSGIWASTGTGAALVKEIVA